MNLPSPEQLAKRWLQLMEMMAALRSPEGGCAWNQQQTHQSLMPYCIEETYELLEAVASRNTEAMQQELGDLLWQVLFHAHIAMEQDTFDMLAVMDGLIAKMLHRHPHVFSHSEARSLAELKAQWQALKEQEGQVERSHVAKAGDGLPPMQRAEAVQKAASELGIDWSTWAPVLAQLKDEIAELEEALAEQDAEAIEEEFGDVLFSAVNLSRHLHLDASVALSGSTAKFVQRFNTMEALAGHASSTQRTAAEWEALWVAAKAHGSES